MRVMGLLVGLALTLTGVCYGFAEWPVGAVVGFLLVFTGVVMVLLWFITNAEPETEGGE